MVEHRQTMRQVHGVVERQERHAGPELYVPGQLQGLGEEQVGGGRILPAFRQVLANPGLMKTELIGQDDLIDVPLVSVGKCAMGRG